MYWYDAAIPEFTLTFIVAVSTHACGMKNAAKREIINVEIMYVTKWTSLLITHILFHFPIKYAILETSFQTDQMKVW